jgi:hypothetical protein
VEVKVTQKEAYIELRRKLDQIEQLLKEGSELAREHSLVFTPTSIGHYDTIDPDRLIIEEHTGYQGRVYKTFRFKDTDLDESLAGRDIYECWVPSQWCN